MAKLNQIIAVVNGKKTEAQNALTALLRKCGKTELFTGLFRSYRPNTEDGETFPSESKAVQCTVKEVVGEIESVMTDFLDLIATQEYANCEAKGDIVVNGTAVLRDVPVSYLLFLEKQMNDYKTLISSLPTLEHGEKWSQDVNGELFASDPQETNKTKKIPQHKVVYEATEHHPAQVETWTEDVVIGKWSLTKYSGAMPAVVKNQLVERVKTLIDAIKFARESANSLEVEQVKVGKAVFGYLFNLDKPLN